jgi:iron complex outermembrane receptor protein
MRRSVLLCSTVFAGLVLSAPAFAQTTTSSDTSSDKAATAQDVVVTGSRIKRNAFTAPDPITVITSEQATLAGYSDTAALLQQSSIAAGSFQTNDQLTGFVVTGGPGAKTLNLRRLGAQRTIVLMDGKRLGPAGVGGTVGPVDLNVISLSSVQRIEVLKDGASSIYGSDAVAGVVNIITKKNHDGGELTALTGQSEGAGGNNYGLRGDWGKTFDKGYIELGGEYFEQERLAAGQRYGTNCSEDYEFAGGTLARIDYTDAVTPNSGHFYKCYNQVSNVARTNFGDLQYLQPNVPYPTAVDGNNVPTAPSAAFGGAPLNTIFARQARSGFPLTFPYANEGVENGLWSRRSVVSPDRHFNLNGSVGYDLNSTTHLYGQFLYSDRVSHQTGSRQLFPTFGAAWLAGNPNNVFAGTGVVPSFPIIQLPSDNEQNVKYYRGVVGLKGDVTGFGWFNRFSYDVYGVYSRSDASYQSDSIYNDRVVATTTSAAACNPATVNLSGFNCSALGTGIPWLSQRVLAGKFNQAERDFLFFKTHGKTSYDQYIVEADVTGDLFDLPAGAVGTAFGVSYRHDKIDDRPDPQVQIGNLWGQTAAGHTAGSDAVSEAYAELTVPVIKNVPFIQNLNFDLSGRYSDYDSYGSTSTYKISGNWTVTPELRFRGSVGTSFRAPALYELYLAHQTSFLGQASVDPCINYVSNNQPIVIQNACAALGIGPTYNGVQNPGGGASAQISTGGGKGNLQAETSQAKSYGVVFTPKHFGIDRWSNLSIAVDYFDFQVHNEVSALGASTIISQCLRGQTAFCTLFTRDLNPASTTYFNITNVSANYVNIAKQGVRGLDATIHADHNFGAWGKLSFDTNLTWTLADKTVSLAGAAVTDQNGTTYNFRGPDFNGNASLQWDYHNLTVFWDTIMIGKGSDTENFGGDTFQSAKYCPTLACTSVGVPVYFKQYTEFTATHNLHVRERFPQWNVDVVAGINNLFDEAPPAQSSGQFRAGTSALNAYDVIGRQYTIQVTKKW